MRLQDIMTRQVETVAPNVSIVTANDLMWRKEIHHLLVMDNDQLVGVLSDTDLGGDKAETLQNDTQVEKVMSKTLVTGHPEMTLKDAINLMEGHHIHCLPVVDEHQAVVGIVTTSDVERLYKRGKAQPPFEGIHPQDPYLPLQKRNQQGSKAKYGNYSPASR